MSMIGDAARIAKEAILEYGEDAVEVHRVRNGQIIPTDHPVLQAALEGLRRAFDPVRDVEEFHQKFGIDYAGLPRALPFEDLQHRLKFMRQELQEYETHADGALFILSENMLPREGSDGAALNHHLAESLDALADIVYVVLGTAHLHGFDFRTAWARVHAANMAKTISETTTSADNKMKQRITKPPGWEAPDHTDLVEKNAHGSK